MEAPGKKRLNAKNQIQSKTFDHFCFASLALARAFACRTFSLYVADNSMWMEARVRECL